MSSVTNYVPSQCSFKEQRPCRYIDSVTVNEIVQRLSSVSAYFSIEPRGLTYCVHANKYRKSESNEHFSFYSIVSILCGLHNGVSENAAYNMIRSRDLCVLSVPP
jgi:hypothetical protein